MSALAEVQTELRSITTRRDAELKRLQEQFEEFRANNSLAEYFKKKLNADTRKKTIEMIEELVAEGGQWYEEMHNNKN